MQNDQNWAFQIIKTTWMGKDGGKCEMIKIGHLESFLDHFGRKRCAKVWNNQNCIF